LLGVSQLLGLQSEYSARKMVIFNLYTRKTLPEPKPQNIFLSQSKFLEVETVSTLLVILQLQ